MGLTRQAHDGIGGMVAYLLQPWDSRNDRPCSGGEDDPGRGEALPVYLQGLVAYKARLAFEDGGRGLGLAPRLALVGHWVNALPDPPDEPVPARGARAGR